ncbi:Ff.00g091620.m01.CDS01 [Fusarium sp. VM40]|nr:Ff.00g091620.m01.CDS01 [Fusarium sp. VM40]
MASDLKAGRRRATSSATRPAHVRRKSRAVIQPKSTHTSDEFLQDFLDPTFDPATFLNSALPPLQQRSVPGRAGSDIASLAELSTQAQNLISQLNAQTSRLSTTLTHLTDDILRSGSRLAYEVELLRGETLGLQETMNETLQDDIKKFVPEGLHEAIEAKNAAAAAAKEDRSAAPSTTAAAFTSDAANPDDPEFVKQLQTLTLVRSRLDSVIKTFGDAMEFVFPPSEVSVSSGFLSVSAPEPGSAQQSSEEKGKQVLKNIRNEISELLDNSDDPVQGIETAAQRIEQLKELSQVWKDTAEEKGRNRFIEGLAKMVEDKHRDLMKEMEQATKDKGRVESRPRKGSVTRDAASSSSVAAAATVVEDTKSPGGFGLISQLHKLRGGL